MEVLREFFCKYHGVQDPIQIDPFQRRVPTFALMRQHIVSVEVGSVVPTPYVFRFPVAKQNETETIAEMAERLKVRFPSDTFRILNAPLPSRDIWFRNPENNEPMEPDLERVSIFHITTRHVWASLKQFQMALRVGFVHQGLERLYCGDKTQNLYQEAGAIKAAYAIVNTTPPAGLDVDQVASPMARNYSNYHFTATMALATERNVMNCIIMIPTDVCQRVGFAEFLPDPDPMEELIEHVIRDRGCSREEFLAEWRLKMTEARKDQVRPTHYVAIPDEHVLSWGLRDSRYAASCLGGARVEVFRFVPSVGNGRGLKPGVSVTLYYMINNLTFEAMLADFKKCWLGRVDTRPLNSLYWDMLPMITTRDLTPDTTVVEGVAMVRSNITYLVPPKLTQEQVDSLVPVLDPTFPSCTQWLPMTKTEAAQMKEI